MCVSLCVCMCVCVCVCECMYDCIFLMVVQEFGIVYTSKRGHAQKNLIIVQWMWFYCYAFYCNIEVNVNRL